MKKIILAPLLFISLMAFSQVKDLPIAFTKKGYVLAIDFDTKMIQVDFITTDKNLGANDILTSQVFSLSNCEIINEKKEKITPKDLRSSDEILVNGQWFQEKDEYTIQKIIVQAKRPVRELEGKVDLIEGDFAYVDGNKVKLAEGRKIRGDDKTGYKGQLYSSFSEIKKGIYAKANGNYDDAGYFLARSFTISPDVETSFDKAVLATDKEKYEKIYSTWIDPIKRKSILGKNIDGIGKITNNETVQDYVNKVGQKLIPDYIKQKSKVNFIFIVIDNPDLLAYVKANGLAVVYTGLLVNLESEAQLATVLGHEITHAIYEHQADEKSEIEKKEKRKNFFSKSIEVGTLSHNAIDDVKKGLKEEKSNIVKNESQKELAQKEKNKTLENQTELKDLLSSTISNAIQKDMIVYSIEQENQADRVGLCLSTLAGYDPKEAPVVWKALYGRYGKLSSNKGEEFDKQMAAFQELQKKDREYDTKGLVNQSILTVLTINNTSSKTKKIRTHPDELKRYEMLNNLIALYWNHPKLLDGTVNNEQEYRLMLKNLAQSSKTIEKPKEKTVEKQTVKPVAKPKVTPKKKQ